MKLLLFRVYFLGVLRILHNLEFTKFGVLI